MNDYLHLVLKHCWFEKIASGEKNSEFRQCSQYWNKRFSSVADGNRKKWDIVVFHDGYTNRTVKRKLLSLDITCDANDLNLPSVWELKLGDFIK